jgi:hypothetical protein
VNTTPEKHLGKMGLRSIWNKIIPKELAWMILLFVIWAMHYIHYFKLHIWQSIFKKAWKFLLFI